MMEVGDENTWFTECLLLSYISTFLSLVVSIVTIPNEEYGVVLVSY